MVPPKFCRNYERSSHVVPPTNPPTNKCRNYPVCKKDYANKCERFLCGTCCAAAEFEGCCSTNHHNRSKRRGTDRPSEAKLQRRSLLFSLTSSIRTWMDHSWFAERLQITGYTVRTFALALLDHVSRSEEDAMASDLSHTIPPAELSRIEAEVEPVVEPHTMDERRAEADEHKEDAKDDITKAAAQVNQVAISSPIPSFIDEAIRTSFNHIDDDEDKKTYRFSSRVASAIAFSSPRVSA